MSTTESPVLKPPADPAIRIALGLHEMMRRNDVPAADIFIDIAPDRSLIVGLGPVGFLIGPVKARSRKAIAGRWRAAVEWWNLTATDADRIDLWTEFSRQIDPVKMVMAIQQAQALAMLPVN